MPSTPPFFERTGPDAAAGLELDAAGVLGGADPAELAAGEGRFKAGGASAGFTTGCCDFSVGVGEGTPEVEALICAGVNRG